MSYSIVNFFIGLIFAPLMIGIINRTKAKFAGRKGEPLLQKYFDIFKLLQKGSVYSKTTTWIFRVSPSIGLACVILALAIIPSFGKPSLIHFPGDLFFLIYILALMIFFTVIAALDTGSSFEGMGGSREVLFSFLAEPALIIGLCVFAKSSGFNSLSDILTNSFKIRPEFILVILAFFIVFLSENSRIPVDDPNTHLELTMIHEVMVLDYSGPDFAFIMYSSSLKMWVLGMILIESIITLNSTFWLYNILIYLAGMLLLSIIVGTVESIIARLRMRSVPKLLIVANALSILAFILVAK